MFQSKVIRVLNLWQKNAVFTTDVIQSIFDLTDNPDYEHPQANPLPVVENSPKLSNYLFIILQNMRYILLIYIYTVSFK